MSDRWADYQLRMVLVALIGACGCGKTASQESRKEAATMTQADEQVARFRKGESAPANVDAFIKAGKPDEPAVRAFAEAMRNENEKVREQVARLVVNIGQKTDPLYSAGARLLRNQAVVLALVEGGLAKQDSARDYTLGALQMQAPAEQLKPHGAALVHDLEQWPDSTALLVIAKAKAREAAAVVDQLLLKPRWAKEDSAWIAKAALGDAQAEKRFVDPFLAATNPREKARLAAQMGYVGTQSALTALAGEMRTDLVIVIEGSQRRSVRLDIIAALRYNFPDRIFFYENTIRDDSGYERIERFCEQTFGVKWKTPRPPFLTIEGFPVPVRR